MSEPIPPSARLRLAAKALTPPLVWSALKTAKDARRPPSPPPEPELELEPQPPEWEYVPEGWARPAGGWNVDAIARVHREQWPSFVTAVAGPGPLGVNHEVPLGQPVPRNERDRQAMVLVFAYALVLAARGKERLLLLDWGGGPGHYAVLAQALLPDVQLDYHSRDLPPLVALGRELLPQHTFHDDDLCLGHRYDLVVASSSLQYFEDWPATLRGLAGATGDHLLVTRVPVALHAPSFVVLQRAHAYGYETEYLGWVLNREELVERAAAAGLELKREFVLPAWLSAAGAPEDPVEHRGYLFGRST